MKLIMGCVAVSALVLGCGKKDGDKPAENEKPAEKGKPAEKEMPPAKTDAQLVEEARAAALPTCKEGQAAFTPDKMKASDAVLAGTLEFPWWHDNRPDRTYKDVVAKKAGVWKDKYGEHSIRIATDDTDPCVEAPEWTSNGFFKYLSSKGNPVIEIKVREPKVGQVYAQLPDYVAAISSGAPYGDAKPDDKEKAGSAVTWGQSYVKVLKWEDGKEATFQVHACLEDTQSMFGAWDPKAFLHGTVTATWCPAPLAPPAP